MTCGWIECFVCVQRRFWSRLTTCTAAQRRRSCTSCCCSTRTGNASVHSNVDLTWCICCLIPSNYFGCFFFIPMNPSPPCVWLQWRCRVSVETGPSFSWPGRVAQHGSREEEAAGVWGLWICEESTGERWQVFRSSQSKTAVSQRTLLLHPVCHHCFPTQKHICGHVVLAFRAFILLLTEIHFKTRLELWSHHSLLNAVVCNMCQWFWGLPGSQSENWKRIHHQETYRGEGMFPHHVVIVIHLLSTFWSETRFSPESHWAQSQGCYFLTYSGSLVSRNGNNPFDVLHLRSYWTMSWRKLPSGKYNYFWIVKQMWIHLYTITLFTFAIMFSIYQLKQTDYADFWPCSGHKHQIGSNDWILPKWSKIQDLNECICLPSTTGCRRVPVWTDTVAFPCTGSLAYLRTASCCCDWQIYYCRLCHAEKSLSR